MFWVTAATLPLMGAYSLRYMLEKMYYRIRCCPIRVIKSRRMRWAGRVAHMGEERGLCRVLVGKPEGKRPLGRPRRRWEDSIKMDLQEVGCGGMDWIELVQDKGQVEGTCECSNEPSGSIKCGEFLDWLKTG
jgi:hypothetical protein